jgi:[acyl-carrier-protein] S-malonyltransferase
VAKERGAKRVQPLKVSAAFHSPLMREAAAGLASAIIEAGIADADIPVVGNVTAEPLVRAEAIRHELAVQVTAPVRWITSVQYMLDQGVDTFVEIGPGSVLTRLIKRIAPDVRLINVCDAESVCAFGAAIACGHSQERGANQ